MTNIINRVTRTSVATNEAMVGQKVTLLDGSRVTITGVASSSAYAHDGGRARISAYLLVKSGRIFKMIEQADVDGKVTAVEDAGGYAHYTFAGKRKPAAKPATKPEAKPAARKPAAKPEAKPAGRKPAAKPEAKKSTKADVKPAGRKPAGNRVRRVAEIHELPEALATIAHDKGLTTKNVSALRHEIRDLLAERYAVGMFEGLAMKSEAHFNSEDNQLILSIGFDFSPYFEAESPAVDVDDASEQLVTAGILTLRALRSMTDAEILAAYAEYFADADTEAEAVAPKKKGGKVKAKPEENDFDDFDDEEEEQEEEQEEEFEEEGEDEESAEIAHIVLPASMFSGTIKPKMAEAATVMGQLAEAWEVDRGDIFPGILLQYDKKVKDGEVEETEVAFVGLAVHKGHTCVMVVETETMEDEKPRRIMIKLEAACERCSPLMMVTDEEASEEDEDDDGNELDAGDFDLDIE